MKINSMKLAELFLNRFLYRDNTQNSETKSSEFVSADSTPLEPASIPSGGAAQDINTSNVTINGAQITPGTIPPEVLDVSNWGWGQTSVFSSTDLNTVSWGAGTFTSASGVAYSIGAGNTGNMAAKTYIYLDLNVSSTAYQITTTSANAVGLGKVLVAVAENAAVTATYMLSEATQIVGDNIISNTINASSIKTGSLVVGTNVGLGTAQDSAGVTTIVGNTVTTGFVNALSITATGQITAGSMLVVNGANTIGFTPAGTNAIFSGTTGSPEFKVTPAGVLTATGATISGALTATSGAIGSFTIGTYLYSGTKTAYNDANAGVHLGSDGIGFGNNVFTVSAAGAMNATSATISGAVTATSGSIGSFTIGTYLYTGSKTAYNDTNAGVHLGSDGIGFGNNVFTVSAAGALTATSGTMSSVTVQTSSGNNRIKLISDTIEFYSGGVLKATLDGSANGAGGVKNTGDFFVANNRTYWIADSTGGATKYGGVGITSGNDFWLTMGTNNTLYIFNNSQAAGAYYMTVSTTQTWIDNFLELSTETANPSGAPSGSIWHFANGAEQFRGVPTGITVYSFDMTVV